MKNFILALSLVTIPLSSLAGIQREWGRHSSPSLRSKTFEYHFKRLPLSGTPEFSGRLWSGDYWPTGKGLINRRWNTPEQDGFRLVSPSKEEVFSMTPEDLVKLSPSEKLDLLNGHYDYPTVKEVAKLAYPRAPEWYGICHGWAPASINHKEPLPKILKNSDGLKIPFGTSDIKALLSWYYAHHHDVDSTRQMGKRCFFLNPGCSSEDLNAGAFHIALANSLGLRGESMVADIEKSELVWNHPVYEYQSEIMDDDKKPVASSARGTVKRIHVKTVMGYVKENKVNSWFPVMGTVGQVIAFRNYEYMLDIDKKGKIIGGEWISKSRPDFIWSMDRATTFKGNYEKLSQLVND